MRRTHSHDPNFLVTCGRPGCCKAYKIFSSFKSHIYRNHPEFLEIDDDIFYVEASLSYSGSDAGDPHSPRSVWGGGDRGAGEERAGGGISTMAGSGREIQKGKLLLFVTACFQSKKRTQERFLTSI